MGAIVGEALLRFQEAAKVHLEALLETGRPIPPWHSGDVPRGIIADIIEDLGVTREQFYHGDL